MLPAHIRAVAAGDGTVKVEMTDTPQTGNGEDQLLDIQLWSDVVCPWCWIGEKRLSLALASVGFTGRARVTIRSYELDPSGRVGPTTSVHEYLAGKYGTSVEQAVKMTEQVASLGAEIGLEMNFTKAIRAPTGEAHQLIQLARATGHDVALMQRLHRAHFTDGLDVADRGVLVHCAGDAGIDESEAERVLQTGAFADDVLADRDAAARIGVQGVPFFVLNGRYAISGAQPVEAMVMALEKAAGAAATSD